MPMKPPFPIAITAGEPSSIAPELLFKGWNHLKTYPNICFFTINNLAYLEDIKKQLNYTHISLQPISSPHEALKVFKVAIPVLDISLITQAGNQKEEKVILGKPNFNHVPFVVKSLDIAIKLAKQHLIKAITTMPIEKWVMQKGGFNFIGHTEYLATQSNIPTPIMLMASPYNPLRVVPLKTHLSLKESINTLSSPEIINSVKIIYLNLKKYLHKEIKIAILGLNPHAGEQGIMGKEEKTILIPAINYLKDINIDVTGPLPPDTAFIKENINKFDIFVGMYHDQVLTPFKALLFDEGVNTTLGLPYIRTSPDHGTALDIASKGIANANSFIASVLLANLWQTTYE